MTRIYVSILLDAEPEQVWQVVAPVERHVDWMADAAAIRFEGAQRQGIGTRFVCDTKVGPLRLTDHMEITEWEPARRMGVRHAGIVTGTGCFTLEPAVQGGTLFAWEEDLRFPWYLGGAIGEAVGGRGVLRRIWRRNLASLKRLVDGP